jgi:hypothetical protein
MRFSVNLRGDLAKLSDAELVERLETAWHAYEAVERSSWVACVWVGVTRFDIRASIVFSRLWV